MTKEKSHSLSAEDKALFESHMQDIKPLVPKSNRLTSSTQPAVSRRHSIPASRLPREALVHSTPLTNTYLSDYWSNPVSSDEVVSFKHPGVSHKQLRELSQNKIRWKAKLDLHGMTSEQAKQAFLSFIHEQLTLKQNCILIVHGKGGRSHEPPVLKNLCYHWLRQIPPVLALHSALAQHGGVGAVYVLLSTTAQWEKT